MNLTKKNKLLKKYIDIFNLQEWNIILEDCCNQQNYGEAEYLLFSKNAVIKINNDLTDEEYDKTLIHEVLHLCLAPIEDYFLQKCPKSHDDIKQKIEHIVIKLESAWCK